MSGSASPLIGPKRLLEERDHRPWALPRSQWLIGQTWETLLFAHWRLPPDALRPLVPPELPIDTFDGSAWLGVTPFRVATHRVRATPHIPGLTSFPEVNVRTYTTIEDKPGIYFLSLDAASRLAVASARRVYRLPYFRARMQKHHRQGAIEFRSERVSSDGPPADLDLHYQPSGPPQAAAPGSLEAFLAERYCLYTLDERRRMHRADIHHPPWPLQSAEADWRHNSMTGGLGLELPDGEALLHFSARQDVLIWPPSVLGGSS